MPARSANDEATGSTSDAAGGSTGDGLEMSADSLAALSSESPVAFGKYRLQRLIARGGMGEVFQANLVGEFGFEKQLVVKTILPELAQKPRFVELFAAEAKTAVQLSHGNIVPIYELGRSGETFYIAMGYVDGPSLALLLQAYAQRATRPSIGISLFIVREVLTGLAYAHTAEPDRPPVVHRDISPRNVLIDRSGQVRIVDFGIALPAEVQVDARGGTTGYVAPEQARAEAADPRADVFSVGCLLYELVTGRRAFPKEGVWSEPVYDDVPDDLRAVIQAALSLETDGRPADAGALLEVLGPVLQAHAATTSDRAMAGELRVLFPDGWKVLDAPVKAGSVTAATRQEPPQTFATRLTAVKPDKASKPAAKSPAPPQRSPSLALIAGIGIATVVAAAALTWSVLPSSDDPPAPTRQAPIKSGAKLEKQAPPPTKQVTPPPAMRNVFVLTVVPADATVSVGGQVLEGENPYRIPLPEIGRQTILIEKEGYQPIQWPLKAGEPDERELAMKKQKPKETGFLKVVAPSVPWAVVHVGNRRLKKNTPIEKFELPAGKHRIVVRCITPACDTERELYKRTVVIKPGEVTLVEAKG